MGTIFIPKHEDGLGDRDKVVEVGMGLGTGFPVGESLLPFSSLPSTHVLGGTLVTLQSMKHEIQSVRHLIITSVSSCKKFSLATGKVIDPKDSDFNHDFAFSLSDNEKRQRRMILSETPLILKASQTSKKFEMCALESSFGSSQILHCFAPSGSHQA